MVVIFDLGSLLPACLHHRPSAEKDSQSLNPQALNRVFLVFNESCRLFTTFSGTWKKLVIGLEGGSLLLQETLLSTILTTFRWWCVHILEKYFSAPKGTVRTIVGVNK